MTERLFVPAVVDSKARRPLLPVAGIGWAFVASVAGAVLVAVPRELARMATWECAAFVGTAVAMVVLALCWRSRNPVAVAAYWGVQTVAASALTFASRGAAAFVLLPVLAQTVFILPRRIVVAYGAAIVGLTFFVARAHTASWLAAITRSGGQVAGVIFVVAFTETLIRERQARARNEELAVTLATTRERARIAREVHDIVGHSLTAIHAQLTGALAVQGRDSERSARLLESARALTEEGLRDIRRSISTLRERSSESLLEQVRGLLATAAATGLETRLVVEGAPQEPSATTVLAVYRVVQECITNAIRHGRASSVRVTLSFEATELGFAVEDDGVGAEVIVPGAGLTGVKERIALLGGEVAIEARQGAGVRLAARVPIRPGPNPPHHDL
ncbi:MAG TPA: sensor histidine kinase [Polyangiaceae bacterium]|jgi:signal transduction histidine kinase